MPKKDKSEGQTDKFKSNGKDKSMSKKQIRARARRKLQKAQRVTDRELEKLYKPLEDWDAEELARGRPRDKNGGWSGKAPSWISREVHERALNMFRDQIKVGMRTLTPKALAVIEKILDDDTVDERGKPNTAPMVKLQAAKILLEHQIGKPVQPVGVEISATLQAIMGRVMVQPALPGADETTSPALALAASHAPRVIEGEVVEDDEDDGGSADVG